MYPFATGTNGYVNTATAAISVQGCTGLLSSFGTTDAIRIFPNPAADRITIDLPMSGEKELVISNSAGSVVYRSTVRSEQETVSLAQLARGIYFIQVRTGSNTHNYKLAHN